MSDIFVRITDYMVLRIIKIYNSIVETQIEMQLKKKGRKGNGEGKRRIGRKQRQKGGRKEEGRGRRRKKGEELERDLGGIRAI